MLDCEGDGEHRVDDRRRHRPLLEIREVAAPQRERGVVDARRDRRHLRAAPEALDAAARRHAPRRRARADAGGARRLPDRLRGARARVRSHVARRGRGIPPQDAHARRQLPDPRAGTAAARAVRQSGLAAVRVAQDRTAARPLVRSSRVLVSSAVLAASSWLYFAAFCAQVVFYGLADLGAWLEARERRSTGAYSGAGCRWRSVPVRRALMETVRKAARVAFTFVMMNYSAVAGLLALRRGRGSGSSDERAAGLRVRDVGARRSRAGARVRRVRNPRRTSAAAAPTAARSGRQPRSGATGRLPGCWSSRPSCSSGRRISFPRCARCTWPSSPPSVRSSRWSWDGSGAA